MAKLNLRKYFSPVFVVLLILSAVMWYLTKLSYTYTAQVPVSVDIDGNRFTVTCLAEGAGYRILAHRIFRQNEVRLEFDDINASPSKVNHGSYVVDPFSLQNAISARNSDIRVISVGEIPEITFSRYR